MPNRIRPVWAVNDFIDSVTRGDVPGEYVVHKFGKNEDVGAAFEPLTIGGVYQTPQVGSATTLRVKAGNANDTAGGSGARLVAIQGLDETGTLVEEDLVTAGASAGPAGSITFIRVFRSYVKESGTYAGPTSPSHVANIVIENSAGTEDWVTIDATDAPRGQSQMGVYCVPVGYTAYVHSYLLTTDSNKAVDFLFFKRSGVLDTAAPYHARRAVVEEVGVQGDLAGEFVGGQPFSELTDIGWLCKAAAAASVTVDFEIHLVKNITT